MSDEIIKENDEIELMDLFLVLWRRKSIIIGIVLFSMVCALLLITFQKNELRTEMAISLSFEGITKGVYPDGKIFVASDIVSPNVLNKLGLSINLSEYVFVEEIIPDYIKAKLDKDPTFIYYPDRFKIVLIEKDMTLFDSNKERAEVLNAIAKTFRESFEKNYIEEPVLSFEFSDDFIQTDEYDDITYVLKNSIELAESVIDQKSKTVRAFRSKDNGYSFPEISSQLFVLKTVKFKNIVSEINTRHLAKNKERLLAKIEDNIKNFEYEQLKNEKMAKISYDLLKTVKDNESIIGSGQSETQLTVDSTVLEKLKENDYTFYLIKLTLDAKTKAIENSLKIGKLNDRFEGIKENGIEFELDDKEITDRLRSVAAEFLKIIKNANTLNTEYLASKFGHAIRIGNAPQHILNYEYKPILILSLVLVGSLFFGMFLSFLVDYVVRYKKND